MKKDYHELKMYTEKTPMYDYGYIDCMFEAAKQVGLKDVIIYSGGYANYSGEMDIHLEAKLNGKDIYFYLRQEYGSCSYCDWLEAVGEDEVINEYVKNLKLALEI